MAGRTLADAIIAVRPDFTKATAGADAAGRKAGQSYSDGFARDADGRLKQAHGKFGEDAQKISAAAGAKSGTGFGTQFGDKFSAKTNSALTGWAKDAGKFLIPVGIVGAIAAIGKIGTAYEDNLNIFQAVTRATGVQMDQVAAKARQLGADTKLPGVSAAGAAAAMTELAKAGLNVSQSMEAARGTLQLARAAGISEAAAAEITSNALNAFGLQAKDTTMIVDQLAATANSSSVEINDVSLAFKQAASVFSGFQGPAVGAKEAMTELNTAIAILGNNGIKGSDAGTSLKEMLLKLASPSRRAANEMEAIALQAAHAAGGLDELLIPVKGQGKGGKIELVHSGMTLMQAAMKGTTKQSDLALAQLEKMNPSLANIGSVAYDSAGKMRPLSQIIDILSKGLKGETQENRNAALSTIFGSDSIRASIALMKGGLPTYEAQRKAVMQIGAASDVAAAKNKGLKGAIDNVRSQVENAAISIYTAVKGPLTKSLNNFADILSNTFAFIGTHIGMIKDLAVSVGILAGAFYGYRAALVAVTIVQRAWAASMAIVAFIQLASEVRSFAAAWALLDAAMVANPIGLVVVAIGALVAGIIYAWKHSETFRTVVLAVWKAIKIGVGATVDWFTGTVWPAMKAVWNGIANAVKWAWHNIIQPTVRDLVAFFKNVLAPTVMWLWHNIIEPAWKTISWIIKTEIAIAQLAIAILVAYFKNVLAPTFMWLWHNIVVPAFNFIRAVIVTDIGIIRGVFNGVVSFLRGTFGPIFTWLWHNIIEPTWKGIRGAISGAWNFIKPILTALGNFVLVNLVGMFKSGVAGISAAWEKLRNAARAPVVFVVRQVINPLIGGFNKLAKIFNTTPIDPITGFATGGQIPGTPSRRDNRIAAFMSGGKPAGTLAVASGEYIVNTDSTLANLGLIDAVNKKHGKVHLDDVMPHLGGYDSGGIVGFFKNLVSGAKGAVTLGASVLSDPKAALTKIANAALGSIPGAGILVDIIRGMASKVISSIGSKIADFFTLSTSGGAAGIGGNASPGFPPWPASPAASRGDSGVWRKVVALIKSTGPVSGSFGNAYRPGDPLWHGSGRAVDWMGFNQDALATFLANHRPLELIHRSSRRDYAYTRGVNKGSFNETLMNQHKNHVHIAMAGGGLVPLAKIAQADFGSVTLNPGQNLIYNGTGKPEPLVTPEGPARLHPDDIAALATAMGQVIGGVLMGTIGAARAAGRQAGRRPA